MVSQEAVHELCAHRGYPSNHACSLRRETLKDVGVRKPKQQISYDCRATVKLEQQQTVRPNGLQEAMSGGLWGRCGGGCDLIA